MGSLHGTAHRIKNTVPGLDWCYLRAKKLFFTRSEYEQRVAIEQRLYRDRANLSDEQPRICHYWAPKYIRPLTEEFGFSQPVELFSMHLRQSAECCGRDDEE